MLFHLFVFSSHMNCSIHSYSVCKLSIGMIHVHIVIPYSGLFSWVEIFVKSSIRPSELNFVVLNFVARWAVT